MHWSELQPSYTLTRSYTFTKAQLIILWISGVVLATLFGVSTAAITGYEVHTIYTSDVNATTSTAAWYQRAPFTWLGSPQTTCQDALLDVGGQYITNNKGFSYTIARMTVNDTGAVAAQIPYRDQILQGCDVSQIIIDLARVDDERLPKNYWSWGGTSARATTICYIVAPDRTYNVKLQIDLPSLLNRDDMTSNFLSQNGTMFYGLWLMSDWYGQIARAMSYSAPSDPDNSYTSGHMVLTRNQSSTDYKDINFFTINYQQHMENGRLGFINPSNSTSEWQNNNTFNLPNISVTINTFSKALYSLLLSDFGVTGSTNALTSPEGAKFLQSTIDPFSYNASQSCTDPNVCAAGWVGNGTIHNLISDVGTVKPTSSTGLASQYLCSIPQQKPNINVAYSIILAEIVFLRSCWALFSLVASWRLVRRSPAANCCPGCLTDTTDRMKLQPLTPQYEQDSNSLVGEQPRQSLLERRGY